MADPISIENNFISKIKGIIQANIDDEQFGVSELAREAGMSRSNLLRKIKKLTKLSASQFIRQERLHSAMEMLRESSLNVSEIAYKVGFSSTSYFIKCFREQYGYPPGEAGKRAVDETASDQPGTLRKKYKPYLIAVPVGVILAMLALVILLRPFMTVKKSYEKSIAVLPFENDSNDSTNLYFVNGLMESILNDLQKIEDLRVISRTSVEKYRNMPKTIPEMGKELNVRYFVEGSGQKIGDQILLHVQLIDASNDKHLWAKEYKREAKDIFQLQTEVAKNIASGIEAVITPEEENRINKAPTDNLVAYDLFLQGRDFMTRGNRKGLEKAIDYFKKAVAEDNKFALAYADIAISYYYLDIFRKEKQYTSQINQYADKALFYDDQLSQSLAAKALFYISSKDYSMAESYLHKALRYNPNSVMIINLLSEFYTNYAPNTGKYLEYALKGIRLDIGAHDSSTASIIYLHVSNALIQSGFVDEAERYINKSLDYNPNNIFSVYVKAYILYAKNRDLEQTKDLLLATLRRDTTRLDVMQEVGKIYYYLRDYNKAYSYYKQFLDIKASLNLDIYPFENAKIAVVFDKTGHTLEAKKLMDDYWHTAENDNSVYKQISLSVYYAYQGDTKKAIEHLKKFSQQENYYYWILLFLKIDPLVDKVKDEPEFKRTMKEIETKFRKHHDRLKKDLEKQGLI